jgi:dihydrodipicolinate synthase/N-acetylneuraminate lyase
MLTRENYRGLFAYPPTPFTGRLALDEDALRANLRRLIHAGVDGIVLAGTSGEFYTLQPEEYRVMARILREETRPAGVHSVMGAIGLCTADAIRQARVATDEGIDAVLGVQPYYLQLTPAELLKFWNDLCRACPEIGVIINHYDWVRQSYSVEIYRALAHLPNLLGSKEAHWDFALWRRIHQESPLVHMSSTDVGWLVEIYRNNAVGVGSLQVCMMPHIVRDVLDGCARGDFMAADRALSPLTEFIARMKLGQGRPHVFPTELEGWSDYSNTARHKALIDAFGFLRAGPPREPGIPVSPVLQEKLATYIHAHYPALVPPPDFGRSANNARLWRRAHSP